MCVKLQEQMIFHRNASDASSVCDALTTGHESMEYVDELLIDIEHTIRNFIGEEPKCLGL